MYSISVAINTIELLAFVSTKQIANGHNKVTQFCYMTFCIIHLKNIDVECLVKIFKRTYMGNIMLRTFFM